MRLDAGDKVAALVIIDDSDEQLEMEGIETQPGGDKPTADAE